MKLSHVNLFPCKATLNDSLVQWPDADLVQINTWGVKGARINVHVEWLMGPGDEPNPSAIATLKTIIQRVALKLGASSILLGLHYDYGAWGARSFKTDLLAGGSPLKQKVWRLYRMLSKALPSYVQFECTPNELAGPDDRGNPGISIPWHNWYQELFYSAIRDGNANRMVWVTPGHNWEIARLINAAGDGFEDYPAWPGTGIVVHDYTGLNPGVNPTTFTIAEADLEGALMNSFIDLKRYAASKGQPAMIGECLGFDFRFPMPDRARALRYVDKYLYCADQVGLDCSAFHADMIFGSTPGARSLPAAAIA